VPKLVSNVRARTKHEHEAALAEATTELGDTVRRGFESEKKRLAADLAASKRD
jgi:hypothetical protein